MSAAALGLHTHPTMVPQHHSIPQRGHQVPRGKGTGTQGPGSPETQPRARGVGPCPKQFTLSYTEL